MHSLQRCTKHPTTPPTPTGALHQKDAATGQKNVCTTPTKSALHSPMIAAARPQFAVITKLRYHTRFARLQPPHSKFVPNGTTDVALVPCLIGVYHLLTLVRHCLYYKCRHWPVSTIRNVYTPECVNKSIRRHIPTPTTNRAADGARSPLADSGLARLADSACNTCGRGRPLGRSSSAWLFLRFPPQKNAAMVIHCG